MALHITTAPNPFWKSSIHEPTSPVLSLLGSTALEPFRVFLAGSIDMGEAANWQESLCQRLKFRFNGSDSLKYEVEILNPRRDGEWKTEDQSKANSTFVQQVAWEQNGIINSNVVFFNFLENSKSPITLLEFGMVIAMKKHAIVSCPKGFWRRGNVEVMCMLQNTKRVTLFDNEKDAVDELIGTLVANNVFFASQ